MTGPSAVVEPAFRALAALRRARVFHPRGVVLAAEWSGTSTDRGQAVPAFRAGYRAEAVVRLSRGIGLPEPLPDVLGLAVKLPPGNGLDGEQDLLLASVVATPVGVHLLRPAGDFTATTYSTLVPHVVAGRHLLVEARAVGGGAGGFSMRTAAGSAPGWRVAIGVAPPGGGPWAPVARLVVGDPLSGPSPSFDANHAGAGIAPPPVLAEVRAAAYRGSRRGRRAHDARQEPVSAS